MTTTEFTVANNVYDELALKLDIPAEKYIQAEERYTALAKHIQDNLTYGIDLYPQGSFMLGTVVRPYVKGKEADYDVDLVCEIQILKEMSTPQKIKHHIGDTLEIPPYKVLLDEEGRRCWTLNYKEEDNIGFHMDCLPCVPESPNVSTQIALTNKDKESGDYTWVSSNPRELKKWFNERQKIAFSELAPKQKRAIFESKANIVYNSIEEIPDRCVKTPLQKVIQIFKRHRDVYFCNKHNEDYKPISIIITILSTFLYEQELDTYEALKNIIYKLQRYSKLFENSNQHHSDYITFDGATWEILSPVVNENYADRWHEDNHARARAFFEWVNQLEDDLITPVEQRDMNRFHTLVENSLKSKVSSSYFNTYNAVSHNQENVIVPKPVITVTNPIKPWVKDAFS